MSSNEHPHLISTAWVDEHKADPDTRIIEVDVDTFAYHSGHVPGAIIWNWTTQLQSNSRQDIPNRSQMELLLGTSGISEATRVILYGDHDNAYAAHAYWQLKIFGHEHVALMNGGRKKWGLEMRRLTADIPTVQHVTPKIKAPDFSLRARHSEVSDLLNHQNVIMIDVRTAKEYGRSRIDVIPDAEGKGHLPGAINIPWTMTLAEDGTFKKRRELIELYANAGITPSKSLITYCGKGARSAHTWFALREYLQFPSVRNFDGTWDG